MMKNIEKCPFCGGEMKVDYKLHPLRYGIIHVSKFFWNDKCYGGTDYDYVSENEAVETWNRKCGK